MKTEKISFGQTYIKPSLMKNLTKENQSKMPFLFGFGEIYPTDIFLGADRKGNLLVEIKHSTLAKHLFLNDEVPKTLENAAWLTFLNGSEKANRQRENIRVPRYSTVINNIDKLSVRDLQYTINDKIKYYYETLAKKFLN